MRQFVRFLISSELESFVRISVNVGDSEVNKKIRICLERSCMYVNVLKVTFSFLDHLGHGRLSLKCSFC